MRSICKVLSCFFLALVLFQTPAGAQSEAAIAGVACGMALTGAVSAKVAKSRSKRAFKQLQKASKLWMEPVEGSVGILQRFKKFPKGRYGRIVKIYNKVSKRWDRLENVRLVGLTTAWSGAALCMVTGGVALADQTLADPQKALKENADFSKLVSAIGMDESLAIMRRVSSGEKVEKVYWEIQPKIEASAKALVDTEEAGFLNNAPEEPISVSR